MIGRKKLRSEIKSLEAKLEQSLLANKELRSDIMKLVEESTALGEDLRGRPFIIEDLEGFTLTEINNPLNTHVEKEIFSLDGFHMSRSKENMWYIVTPAEITVPVEINDMFEGIMILRALGLKRLTFHGLMTADELVNSMMEDISEVAEMRDKRIEEENNKE